MDVSADADAGRLSGLRDEPVSRGVRIQMRSGFHLLDEGRGSHWVRGAAGTYPRTLSTGQSATLG